MRADLAVAMALITGPPVPGYVFTTPSAIALGNMAPGTTATGNSTDGSLVGDNGNGYIVTGIDAKLTYKGYMVSGTDVLASKHQISNEDANYVNADTAKTFLDTLVPTNEVIALYVSQLVAYTDAMATGYTITITFTVTEK